MSNILVTGSNGQLGSELKELVNNTFFFTDTDMLDITNFQKVEKFCKENSIKVIINCAAYTAVDKAESEIETANKINNLAVRHLAIVAKEQNIKLIHISTDYVFNGKNYKPYSEEDNTSPQNIYGKTKLDGEIAIQEINPPNSIIIRTSWLYGSHGTNFIKTILELSKARESLNVVFDQIGTPTYATDLAKAILSIVPKLENKNVEIYHYSNEGVLSWYDLAREITKMTKISCTINPIQTKEYPTLAVRPHYSLLNKEKIKKKFNLTIPYWKDSLCECLEKMREKK